MSWPSFVAELPVDDAAGESLRLILTEQLDELRELAVLAARHSAEDPEHVHQLRVGARRAAATLAASAGFLGPKREQRLARGLQRLRSLAGVARNLDVALAQVLELPTDSISPRLRLRLVHATALERGAAQVELAAGLGRLRRKHRFQTWHADLSRLAWRGAGDEPTWGELARLRLAGAVETIAAAGEPWPVTARTLHSLRIAVKHARYQLELFQSAWAPQIGEWLELLRRLQDDLGVWHDLRTRLALWRTWLEMPWAPSVAEELGELVDRWDDEEPALRESLAERWSGGELAGLIDGLRPLIAADDSPETN
ncbi:MAG: CHAD domain-containing protein [Pirellulales bacterium]